MMCGIEAAIEYLKQLNGEIPGHIINRLRYIQAKNDGVKPRYHKGIYGSKHEYWTCGNCGTTIKKDVVANYCDNCGYRIKWDSTRCLTK